jgi:hypothetical protein
MAVRTSNPTYEEMFTTLAGDIVLVMEVNLPPQKMLYESHNFIQGGQLSNNNYK